jgi:hypothetical protein
MLLSLTKLTFSQYNEAYFADLFDKRIFVYYVKLLTMHISLTF